MLTPLVRDKIIERAEIRMRYSKDCDVLAAKINEKCKSQISPTTLKRIFGFVSGTSNVRRSTLDVLACYLDYEDWDELMKNLLNITDSKTSISEIKVEKLPKDKILMLQLGPIAYTKLHYKGGLKFHVLEGSNTEVKPGDEIEVQEIKLHYPLLCKEVLREGVTYNNIVLGSVTGVTKIQKANHNQKTKKYGTVQ